MIVISNYMLLDCEQIGRAQTTDMFMRDLKKRLENSNDGHNNIGLL